MVASTLQAHIYAGIAWSEMAISKLHQLTHRSKARQPSSRRCRQTSVSVTGIPGWKTSETGFAGAKRLDPLKLQRGYFEQPSIVDTQKQAILLGEKLRDKKKIVVIAGAGISVSAGSKSFSLINIKSECLIVNLSSF